MFFATSVPDCSDCKSDASVSWGRELSMSERFGVSMSDIDGVRSNDSNASFSARSLDIVSEKVLEIQLNHSLFDLLFQFKDL